MEIGIVLYNIELNDCLNGVYTNDGAQGEIYNEVAKLKPNTKKGVDGVSGEYDCFYFDSNNRLAGRELSIKPHASSLNNKVYWFDFIWKDENLKPEFVGVGYKMNDRQIAVHYKYIGKK